MIELTDRTGEKFYLNIQLVERVIKTLWGSEIILTNGRSATCEETAKQVANRISMMQMSMSGNLNKHVNHIP